MVAPAESRAPRGALPRALFLVALLVGVPWVGRNVLGTLTWSELTRRTQDRLHELAFAGGPFVDPEVDGSSDFEQGWGANYSQGRSEPEFRYTLRTAGAGSSRLVVRLEQTSRGPEASIRVDDLGFDGDRLPEIARGLERFFAELEVKCAGIEEREVVRVLSGETFEVPAGRLLEVFELGLPATGTSGSVLASVKVLVDGVELLMHGFSGHRFASGLRVQLGDHMGHTIPPPRPLVAGECLSVEASAGERAYVLGVLR